MLGKVKKHTSRLGHRPVRFQFAITINTVTLPRCCTVADQAILSMCLERGMRASHTGNFIYSKSSPESVVTIPVKERLEIEAVLYKDIRSDHFQSKTCKLVVRELIKKGLLGQYGYKRIGKCNLNLHEIVSDIGFELSCKKDGLILFENLKGVSIRFTIVATIQKIDNTSRYLHDNCDVSSNSSISDITEMTAMTSMQGPRSEYVPTTLPVFDRLAEDIQPYTTSEAPRTEMPDRIAGEGNEEKSDGECSDLHNIPLGTSDTSPEVVTPTPPAAAPSPDTSTSSPISGDNGEHLQSLPSVVNLASTQEAYDLYDQHLKAKMLLIHRLERSLAQQSTHSATQLTALKTELTNTVTALRKEKVARAVIVEVTHKGDDVLVAALSEARDEAARAVAERAAVLVELQDLREEVALHREQIAQLRQQQAQEMELSQQAAAVAASASVRRAEAEDEAQQLLDQLITVKMEHANVSMELDVARRHSEMLQRRLGLYANEIESLQARCLELAPVSLL